jgi:hypothetical protein
MSGLPLITTIESIVKIVDVGISSDGGVEYRYIDFLHVFYGRNVRGI